MEVAVPNIALNGLIGLSASWHAWQTFRGWSQVAAGDVARQFEKAGLHWVPRHGTKGPYSFEENHERYAAVLWPPPMRADYLKLFMGVFVGRPQDPPLVEGVPDLVFILHVDPNRALGKQLRTDADFLAAVETWRKRDAENGRTRREFWPEKDSWEILRGRLSGLELVQSGEQEAVFKAWMLDRAKELLADGVMARLTKLEADTRANVGSEIET